MMEHFGIKPPVDVPMVRVVDEEGHEVIRGWYYRHVNRQPSAFGDCVRENDVQHVVMHDSFADWNMPKRAKSTVITPPYRIEIINDKPWEMGA